MLLSILFLLIRPPTRSTLFPYTTLFRSVALRLRDVEQRDDLAVEARRPGRGFPRYGDRGGKPRSEEHTSELQSRFEIVCRLLLEKKNNATVIPASAPTIIAANVNSKQPI